MKWLVTERGVLLNLEHVYTLTAHLNGVVEAEGATGTTTVSTLATSAAEAMLIVDYVKIALETRTVPLDFRPGQTTYNQACAVFERKRQEAHVAEYGNGRG